MAMAYYQSDRFEDRRIRPDVSVEDEDKDHAIEMGTEVCRVRAIHEPSETVFANRQLKSKQKWRGVRLGSFVCGCFGVGEFGYDGVDSSIKSNSVRAPPTDSTSAASDGTPFDNADSLGSEPDLFEPNTIIGAELTAARMQPLPSTGFADGMVPTLGVYYQQSVFEQANHVPTLLSHRSLQVQRAHVVLSVVKHLYAQQQAGRPAPLQRTATYTSSTRHAGPPSAFFPAPEANDCDLPEVCIPQEAGGISHAYLPAANTVCVRYQPARLTRSTTLA